MPGNGIWDAVWMIPLNKTKWGKWPQCGEIDLAEHRGRVGQDNWMRNGLIYGKPRTDSGDVYHNYSGSTYSEDFFHYSLDWSPGLMAFYINHQETYRVSEWFTTFPDGSQNYPGLLIMALAFY